MYKQQGALLILILWLSQMYTDENLLYYIDLYERSVNDMLSKPPHYPNQFDHIMGRPGEKLFNYEI